MLSYIVIKILEIKKVSKSFKKFQKVSKVSSFKYCIFTRDAIRQIKVSNDLYFKVSISQTEDLLAICHFSENENVMIHIKK